MTPAVVGGVLVAILIAVLAVFAIRADINEKKECLADGGAWVIDHYTTIYIKSGQVLIPVENPVHGCKK